MSEYSEKNEINIDWQDMLGSVRLQPGVHNEIVVRPEVIPIIFIPGIMGTRLANGEGEIVWDPDKFWKFVKNYVLPTEDPADRRNLLIGKGQYDANYLRVCDDSSVNSRNLGWESLVMLSYRHMRFFLHSQWWPKIMRLCFDLPAHAFGYNWTDSPERNSKILAKFISDLIDKYKRKGSCKRVILVTHSMGGLVARAACRLHGAEENVLGVVHTVQPASGSPAAYWRMKGGFERPEWGANEEVSFSQAYGAAWGLGNQGKEVSVLLANMPGGLSLLPNKDYFTNDGAKTWLKLYAMCHVTNERMLLDELPKSDPYQEIYLERRRFWGLVEDVLINPDGNPDEAWQWYRRNLLQAEIFHDRLGNQQHANTYHMFGGGERIRTAHQIEFDLKGIWTQNNTEIVGFFSPAELKKFTFKSNRLKGATSVYSRPGFEAKKVFMEKTRREGLRQSRYRIVMSPPKGAGDGTVPQSSGSFLAPVCGEGKRSVQIDNVGHEPSMCNEATLKFIRASIQELCMVEIWKTAEEKGRVVPRKKSEPSKDPLCIGRDV